MKHDKKRRDARERPAASNTHAQPQTPGTGRQSTTPDFAGAMRCLAGLDAEVLAFSWETGGRPFIRIAPNLAAWRLGGERVGIRLTAAGKTDCYAADVCGCDVVYECDRRTNRIFLTR